MRITQFNIGLFKGIVKASINVSDEIPGNVITLIGLNESGKTTILEALSHFVTEDKETASLVQTVHQKASMQELIPKDKKAAFNDEISITATGVFNDDDVESIAKHLKESHGLILQKGAFAKTFSVSRQYTYKDSVHSKSSNLWSVTFPLRTPKGRKTVVYDGEGNKKAVWLDGITLISKMMPQLVYFPTFLFNFPDRIYLESDGASVVDIYYTQLLQDVLNSQSRDTEKRLSVQRHIVDIIKTRREAAKDPDTFVSEFYSADEKDQIDAVTQDLSNEK